MYEQKYGMGLSIQTDNNSSAVCCGKVRATIYCFMNDNWAFIVFYLCFYLVPRTI